MTAKKPASGGKRGRPTKEQVKARPEPKYDEEYKTLIPGLSVADSVFVNAYLHNGFNATRAAQAANIGGTDNAQRVAGSQKLTNPNIRKAIDDGLNKIQLGRADILGRLAAQAFTTVDDFLNDAGELDLQQARRRGALPAVQEITETTDASGNRKVKVKLYSAQRALEMLGHAQNALKFNAEVTGVTKLKDALGLDDTDNRRARLSKPVLIDTATYTPPRTMRELVRDPLHFSRLLYINTTEDRNGVPVPVEKRLIPNWLQRKYLAERTPRDLILKPRQEGISTIIQADIARYCYTRLVNCVTLMDTDRNTNAMRRKQDLFYKKFPAAIDMGDDGTFFKPYRDSSNKVYSAYDTGAIHTMATAGAESGGRGDALNVIHLSEAALYKNLYEVRLSVVEAGKPFWVVLESTAHGARGDFYELCMKANDGDTTWTLHFYAWFHVPTNRTPLEEGETLSYTNLEYQGRELWGWDDQQIKWRRQKKAATGYKFEQEYPETVESAFLTSVAGMFGTMEGNFGAPTGATPQPGTAYRMGIDTGQMEDYTVVSIGRADIPLQVALLRIRQMPYPVMRNQYIIPLIKLWRPEFGCVEIDGIGLGMLQELDADLKREGISGVELEGVLSRSDKPTLIQNYNDDLAAGFQLLPDEAQRAEHLMYTAKPAGRGRWEYGAPDIDGAHDDTVMADALMARARRKIIQRATVTIRKW